MNPFSNSNSDQFNGSKPHQDFNDLDFPLPEVDEPTKRLSTTVKTLKPTTQKEIKRFFLLLLVFGLLVGGSLAVVIVNLMDRAGLTEVPQYQQNDKK